MMYRVIVLNNDGTQQNEAVKEIDLRGLVRSVDKREIKSFTVVLE